MGPTKEVLNVEPLKEKWESFGWKVAEVNGHDFTEIETALKNISLENKKPNLVIAHTQKGKGISFMENKNEWHYWSVNKENYEKAIAELEKNIR